MVLFPLLEYSLVYDNTNRAGLNLICLSLLLLVRQNQTLLAFFFSFSEYLALKFEGQLGIFFLANLSAKSTMEFEEQKCQNLAATIGSGRER
jgi:hypothetical protein